MNHTRFEHTCQNFADDTIRHSSSLSMNLVESSAICRKQQGVWASWGKPYKCHGVPNVNPLQQTPMPEAPYSLDGPNKLASFKFFADPNHVISSAREGEKHPKAAAKRKSASQIKKEKLTLAWRSNEMDKMLMKMGLLFPRGALFLKP